MRRNKDVVLNHVVGEYGKTTIKNIRFVPQKTPSFAKQTILIEHATSKALTKVFFGTLGNEIFDFLC